MKLKLSAFIAVCIAALSLVLMKFDEINVDENNGERLLVYAAESTSEAEDKLTEDNFPEQMQLTFDVGLRSSPSADTPVVCIVPAYGQSNVVDGAGEWTCLLYEGQVGWVEAEQLLGPQVTDAAFVTGEQIQSALSAAAEAVSEEQDDLQTVPEAENITVSEKPKEPEKPSASAEPPQAEPEISIKLDVPHYLQGDSRWASQTISNTSYTIGKVGCALSCVAMADSYRTGAQITPLQVAKTYSFSDDADIYWPSGYNIIVGTDDYLQIAYNALLEGKPVVFGCKKANGTQHWVVITGYEGSFPLTSSGFLINDPASSSRRTLDAYMSSYPYFYKLLYYSS